MKITNLSLRLITLTGLVGVLASAHLTGAEKSGSNRPNILFIMADDHAAHALCRRKVGQGSHAILETADVLLQEGDHVGDLIGAARELYGDRVCFEA